MKTSKVYLVANTVNDKVYVGFTTQKKFEYRWANHKRRALKEKTDTHFYRALRLYGVDKFYCSLLGEYPTVSAGKHAEKLWIILLNASHSDFGYNTTLGGEAPKHSEETKRKIGNHRRLNPLPKEYYLSEAFLSSYTPERAARQSERIKQA